MASGRSPISLMMILPQSVRSPTRPNPFVAVPCTRCLLSKVLVTVRLFFVVIVRSLLLVIRVNLANLAIHAK